MWSWWRRGNGAVGEVAQQTGEAVDIAAACQETRPEAGAAAVLERLLAAHEAWFDVRRDVEVAGRAFAGFAEFHEHGEKYVLTRRAKLWEVATNEYVFFEVAENLDTEMLAGLVAFMKERALPEVVKPHPDHMFSNLSLVVVADAVGADVERAVRSVRFRKNFKFGFWGWSDLRVAVVDLSAGKGDRTGRVMTNAAGKALRATLEANLDPAAHRSGRGRTRE